MKSPVVCMNCLTVIDKRADRFEKRTEYRGVILQDRFRVRKLGDICKTCVLKEMGEDPTDQPAQQRMLS